MVSETWDESVGHPMQSWEWGEFREKMGNRVTRVTGDNQYQIIWSKIFGNLWFGYCPMSSIPTNKDLELLKQAGAENDAVGIRMEPNVKRGEITNFQFSIFNQFFKSGRKLFKSKTFWIDLRQGEEELMKRMNPKCRYNIRLAEKHGVRIVRGDIENYLRLMFGKTTKRQKIYAHSEKYHRELAKLDFVKMFQAEHEGKVTAAWMMFAWKDFVYYAYGAFDDEYKNLMAPVLGLWEIIKWGKQQGYKTLDLWGAEEGRGFSRFKEQFGPTSVEMVGTYDLPINKPLYYLFRVAEEIRWRILRLIKI